MKKYIFILVILFSTVLSCEESAVEKPENLIKKREMIDMMVDLHIAEATFNNRKNQDTLVGKSSSMDFYQSVLNKYQVPDTLFEKSLIFYLSSPKSFEKMYRQVSSKLSEMEQEYSGRKNELIDIGNSEIQPR